MNACPYSSSSNIQASQVRKHWMETRKKPSNNPTVAATLLSMLVLRQVHRSHRKQAPSAPVIDAHIFVPLYVSGTPPPMPPSIFQGDEFHPHLAVPCNTPAGSPLSPPPLLNDNATTSGGDKESSAEVETPVWASSNVDSAHVQLEYMLSDERTGLVGLGIEGIVKVDGSQFDGLGRLCDGFKPSEETTRVPPRELDEEERRTITRRSRVRTVTQPRRRYDLFCPRVPYNTFNSLRTGAIKPIPTTTSRAGRVYIRSRARQRATTETPTTTAAARTRKRNRTNDGTTPDVSRATISTQLKREASLTRRATLDLGAETSYQWRV